MPGPLAAAKGIRAAAVIASWSAEPPSAACIELIARKARCPVPLVQAPTTVRCSARHGSPCTCGRPADDREAEVRLKPRHVFLKIEPLARYSPLAPILCSRHYGRDCMFNPGHELGRVSRRGDRCGVARRSRLPRVPGPGVHVPKTAKLIAADVNEPPWYRRVPGAVLYAQARRASATSTSERRPRRLPQLPPPRARATASTPTARGRSGSPRTDGRRSDEILPGERWTYVFDATDETIGAWPLPRPCPRRRRECRTAGSSAD